MKNKLYLVVVSVCMALSACLKVEPKDQEHNAAPETLQNNEYAAQANIQYIVRGLHQPQQYEVEFTGVRGLFVQKKRKGVTTTDRSVEDVYIDSDVLGGEQITYLFYDEKTGHQHILQSIDVDIPRDLLIEKKVVLTDASLKSLDLRVVGSGSSRQIIGDQFHRVFFEQDSYLITNGESLQLIADEIHFNHAVIQTFEPGSMAAMGRDGRGGGFLDFRAQKISGNVFVELRGEHGGQGMPGPAPDEKLKGADGRPGISPVSFQYASCSGGQLFCGECKTPGTVGTTGSRGDQGYPGGMGMRGGASGELRWRADSVEELNWQVQKLPGDGGAGGVGGLGGQGGKGGVTPAAMYCASVAAAADGAQGPVGLTGQNGYPGGNQQACVLTKTDQDCR